MTKLAFDIGANIGAWAFENIYEFDKIISVEASPMTFHKLSVNCGENGQIIPLNYAVTNCPDEYITFYQAHCDVLSTTNVAAFTNPDSRFYNYCPYSEIKAKTITLDRLIELYGKPDLLKIDVESAEFECISSLTQHVDLLCFEWAAETHDITFRCLEYLHDRLGYNRFSVQIGDNYTWRPEEGSYQDLETFMETMVQIKRGPDGKDWGMIWCRTQ
jgi:FkbM family methyltransferase